MKDTLVDRTLLWIICFTVYGLQQLVDSYWTTASLSRSCSSTSCFSRRFLVPSLPSNPSPSSPIFTFRWWPSFCRWRIFIMREISFTHLLFCCSVTKSCPVVLLFHALWLTMALCPGDFPGQNAGMGCHFLSTLYHPDPGMLPKAPAFAGGSLTTEPPGKPVLYIDKYVCMYMCICMYVYAYSLYICMYIT